MLEGRDLVCGEITPSASLVKGLDLTARSLLWNSVSLDSVGEYVIVGVYFRSPSKDTYGHQESRTSFTNLRSVLRFTTSANLLPGPEINIKRLQQFPEIGPAGSLSCDTPRTRMLVTPGKDYGSCHSPPFPKRSYIYSPHSFSDWSEPGPSKRS
jgi:hypothetical protein